MRQNGRMIIMRFHFNHAINHTVNKIWKQPPIKAKTSENQSTKKSFKLISPVSLLKKGIS